MKKKFFKFAIAKLTAKRIGCGNLLFAFLLTTSYFLLPTSYLYAVWNTQPVDSTNDVGQYSSLALDSNQYPHIVYYDATLTTQDLKYSSWTSAGWSISTIDTTGNSGQLCSIAIDKNSIKHIVYWYDNGFELKYASSTPTGWAIQTIKVLSSFNSYYRTSVDVDSNNNPHIIYSDSSGGNYFVKCASWTGTAWNITTVDTGGSGFYFNSMKLDSNNRAHISYYDSNTDDLKYSSYTSVGWSTSTVDTGGTAVVGEGCCIVVDTTTNRPHISYYDWTNDKLKYAKLTAAGWDIQTLTDCSIKDTSIALDKNWYPHICFSVNPGGVKYVKWTGSAWTSPETVNSSALGYFCSLKLDSSENGHISYYYNNGTTIDDLFYSNYTNQAPTLSWTGETNYTTDGLHPETGDTSTTFVYRVKYTDADNDAPKSGYPKVHIKKGGAEISGSPFTMTYVSGNYNTGAIYTYPKTVSIGTDYTYYFEAQDVNGASATGEPTTEKPGPVVSASISITSEVKLENNVFMPCDSKLNEVTIECASSKPGTIIVKIYTLDGELVKTFDQNLATAGKCSFKWDGKNLDGGVVASGIYYAHIEGPDFTTIRKICVLKGKLK